MATNNKYAAKKTPKGRGINSLTPPGSETWYRRLLWAFIGWIIGQIATGTLDMAKANWMSGPNMMRAGLWQSSIRSARLVIDEQPGQPIVLFLDDEGFLIVNVVYGPERWHGDAVCWNTGVFSGLVTIDGPANGLKLKFDRVNGQDDTIPLERVRTDLEQTSLTMDRSMTFRGD